MGNIKKEPKIKAGKLSAEELHEKGGRAREDDEHLKALKLLTLAIPAYREEGKYHKLPDVLQDRVLTWKHLFLLTNDKIYAILAQKDAETSLVIAQEYKLRDKLHSSYFRLGEVAMLYEDFPKAIKYYSKSLKLYTGTLAEKGDFRYHLGEALYRNGEKKKGKEVMMEGLEEINRGADEVDPFVIHVWQSGVNMRLADLLRDDEPEQAKKFLKKAIKIARSDKKLVIRRRQIKKLKETFKD